MDWKSSFIEYMPGRLERYVAQLPHVGAVYVERYVNYRGVDPDWHVSCHVLTYKERLGRNLTPDEAKVEGLKKLRTKVLEIARDCA